jgi:hypothetical protein
MRARVAAITVALTMSCAAPAPVKNAQIGAQLPPPIIPAPAEPSGISGRIRLSDGSSAAGSLVALVPHFELEYPGPSPDVPMVIADAEGRYAFPSMALPGRFGVTATLGTRAVGGYGGAHDLAANSRLTVDITLGKDGFPIHGTVRDAEGTPVKGARIDAVRFSYDALVYIDKVTASHVNPGAN